MTDTPDSTPPEKPEAPKADPATPKAEGAAEKVEAAAEKVEATAEKVEDAAKKGGRKLYQILTHNEHGQFSGKRTFAFAAGASVAAGGAYLLTRSKDQGPEQASWQERTSAPASQTAQLAM